MKPELTAYIAENKIATLCCIDLNGKPYCFNCFYVFEPAHKLLLFKSSEQSFHSQSLKLNAEVSGTILPQKMNFMAMKGLQFTGEVLYGSFPEGFLPSNYYHKQNPLALAKAGEVWCIQLKTAKMTDSTRVFGEKLVWEKAG
ncbi:hypothetical protein BCY91_04780 [Pelobium manganitolerans]|uniref:Uncharacterized protein n=1 Tax=Pelobium manganitolerans TaxID=1842495 RepID=A0A419S5T3_9SPHI|nr:pyridoxamine 5'-phosphate oxidase family protein [Pelobium manganitolerans]RKD16197.1 hypothetical protein BCY91_04780 [Pelobium manganitolerans]